MKDITLHHDGHGLNESIRVFADDEPGPGGAHHSYWMDMDMAEGRYKRTLGYLFFQRGPRSEEGSTPGVTEGAVLAVLIDRLTDFQAGPFPSVEGDKALYHLETALSLLKARADNRAERGVLGKNEA